MGRGRLETLSGALAYRLLLTKGTRTPSVETCSYAAKSSLALTEQGRRDVSADCSSGISNECRCESFQLLRMCFVWTPLLLL